MEAELGALFTNYQKTVPIQTTLIEMYHPQPATHVASENSSEVIITNVTTKKCRSHAIGMRFYWIRDRAKQGKFLVLWKPRTHNLANYPTKHHPTNHCRQMRPTYLKPTAKYLHSSQDKRNIKM